MEEGECKKGKEEGKEVRTHPQRNITNFQIPINLCQLLQIHLGTFTPLHPYFQLMFLPRNLTQLGLTPLSHIFGGLPFLAFFRNEGGLVLDFEF
jgi:hypothetical protein